MPHKIVKKIWGSEEWIVNRDYCGKKLILKKGFRCSMHHHKNKDETFYIQEGKVLMECGDKKQVMVKGDSILVPPHTKHRFTGIQDSEIIEFSTHHEDEDSYRDEFSGKVNLDKMKCLVTGGAGFIGSNLALELEKQGHEVIIVDNLLSGHKDNLKGIKGNFIELDVSELFDLKDKFDVIFHQAAITDPRYPNDEETYQKNIDGFKNMINLAKKDNAKLVYASTAGLYGNGPVPMKESQEKEILSSYGKSKLDMDLMAEKLFNQMHIVGLRYFNVFGPREAHKGRPASMIYHLAKQIKENKQPRLFKFGEQKRDHIYVKDAVDATIKAIDAKSGIYNVGTGIATTFNELIKILNEIFNTNFKPEYFDMPYDPKSYQSNTQADTTKAENELGFKSQYSLKDGIKKYMEGLKWIKN